MMPMKKETMSVTEVMVMETAASLRVLAMRSGTGSSMFVRRHAASITKVSSIPIPAKNYRANFERATEANHNCALLGIINAAPKSGSEI